MRILLSLCFMLLFVSVNGQSKIEYIDQQLSNLEMELKKHNSAWSLDNVQKSKLITIYEEKFRQVSLILNSDMDKLTVSDNLTKIDKEFKPKVESILPVEQRLALNKQNKQYSVE